MQIHLINLARRPDRLAAMQAQAARLGLVLARVDAVDAKNTTLPEGRFEQHGPLGEIPEGDKACFLSHERAWDAFLAGSDAYAAVLEDDVVLSPSAARFLKEPGWIPAGLDVIKLEHYGPPGQAVLLSDLRDLGAGFRLGQMQSRHTGGAAYILSRKAAQRLMREGRINLPVDHLLFNPNNSPLARELGPWQLQPAIARQQDFIGDKSDIEKTRIGLRTFNLTYVLRELVRFGYDLKLLPRQLFLAASGRAKFVRIGTE